MNQNTINQLNALLNTEVTPQQLRKIEPTIYYLIKVTKRSKNNHVTHGILLTFGSDLQIQIIQHQTNINNTYIIKPNTTQCFSNTIPDYIRNPVSYLISGKIK